MAVPAVDPLPAPSLMTIGDRSPIVQRSSVWAICSRSFMDPAAMVLMFSVMT
jgi:hypothetical protein